MGVGILGIAVHRPPGRPMVAQLPFFPLFHIHEVNEIILDFAAFLRLILQQMNRHIAALGISHHVPVFPVTDKMGVRRAGHKNLLLHGIRIDHTDILHLFSGGFPLDKGQL